MASQRLGLATSARVTTRPHVKRLDISTGLSTTRSVGLTASRELGGSEAGEERLHWLNHSDVKLPETFGFDRIRKAIETKTDEAE